MYFFSWTYSSYSKCMRNFFKYPVHVNSFLSFFSFSSAFQKAYYPPTALMCPSLINPKSGMENMSEICLITGKCYSKNYSYFRPWSQITATLHCKQSEMRVVLPKWTQDQAHGYHFLSDHSPEKINLIA